MLIFEKIEIWEELLLFNDWLNETEMNATLNIGYEVGNFTVVKYLKTYGLNNAESCIVRVVWYMFLCHYVFKLLRIVCPFIAFSKDK